MSQLNIFDLSRKVAVVTGGGRGIGKTIALALANAGADIVIADLLYSEAKEVAKDIRELGRLSLAIETDVTIQNEVEEMTNKVLDHFGHLDILINNAGINIISPAEDFRLEDWNRVVNVNLTGVFLSTKAIGRLMIKQKKGKIINIASIHGFVGSIHNAVAYNSTKAGVINLTRSLAVEWGAYNINVNAIAPGIIKTDLTTKRLENREYYNYWIDRTPLKRIGKPEDLIGAAIFLSSEASDWLTGQTIVIDGGYTAL